jgi:TatD DNase family protein
MLIDSHCHITSLERTMRQQVLEAGALGYRFIDSSIDVNSSLASIALSDHYAFVYTALGFHPYSADKFSQEVISTYEDLIREHKSIVAIGEIGLDFKASICMHEQEAVFSQFIRLAKRCNLPIVIHNRLDNKRVLDILDGFYSTYEEVVFHCFSYGRDFLDRILEKGGYVSFSLNTLRKNKSIIDSLKNCPLENMLIETDSPYMKIKDQVSTPLDIEKVYNFVSETKGISLEELKTKVSETAEKIFSF